MRRALLLGIAALAVVACSPAEPVPSRPDESVATASAFAVPWSQERFGTITIHVIDQSSLVVGADKLAEAGDVLGGADVAAVADPAGSTIAVAWIGGVCRFGPTVTVIGDSEQLLISVRPEAGAGLPTGIACDDIGALYGIDLELETPIQQDAVVVETVE